METKTLGNIAECSTTRALSLVASAMPAGVARPRTAPIIDTRSLAGVGSSGVSGMWRTDLVGNDPKTYAHQDFDKFTTRQGPPTCSPPA